MLTVGPRMSVSYLSPSMLYFIFERKAASLSSSSFEIGTHFVMLISSSSSTGFCSSGFAYLVFEGSFCIYFWIICLNRFKFRLYFIPKYFIPKDDLRIYPQIEMDKTMRTLRNSLWIFMDSIKSKKIRI